MANLQSIFIFYLIAINALAYLFMWYDKYQAKKKDLRISENALLTLAVAFGAAGIFLGMKAPLYHKAGKPKFKWVILPLFIINLILIVCVFKYILP